MIPPARRLAALLLATLFCPAAVEAGPPEPLAVEPLAVEAVQRRLDVERPALERVGALRSRGLLELTSPDPRFGGLSGLLVDPDGRRLEAVTDEGHWIALRLDYDGAGRLVGIGDGRIAALAGVDGRPLEGKPRQDSESLARGGPDDAGLLVAFERKHRIWRYARSGVPGLGGALTGPPAPLPEPPGLAGQPGNEGIEALERLADGSLLAIGSKTARPDHYPAWLLRPGGSAWQRLWYFRSGPYEPTGAALLPDGDLLVLERRFSLLGGLAVRLLRVSGATIAPGATLRGRELAVLAPPLTVDNLEGVAARRGPAGETLVYLLSDDNFSFLQRSLLMLFVLEE